MRKFAIGLAGLASIAFAAPAMADQITLGSGDIGTSFSLTYDGYTNGTNIDGLTGAATFKLTGVSGNDYTFDYSITNTSSAPLTSSRLSGFAFNTDPNIVGATSTGAFSYTTLSQTYPNGIGKVDVCFKDASTGSCAGGANGGLAMGETGTGAFTLSFASPVSSLTLSDFFDRYQSINGPGLNDASASGTGTITTTSSTSGGTPVPEPGMLGLFGLGIIGLALARKRRLPARADLRPAMA